MKTLFLQGYGISIKVVNGRLLITNGKSLSFVEQANVLAPLVRLLGMSKADAYLTYALYGNERMIREEKQLDKLISLTMDFVTGNIDSSDPDFRQNILHLIYYINDPNFSHDEKLFDNVLRMYTHANEQKTCLCKTTLSIIFFLMAIDT